MKRIIIFAGAFAVIACPVFSQNILSLERCKELALKNSTQAKNAELSVEVALQQQKEAFTSYFPSVSATGMGFAASKPMMSMEMDMSAMMQPMMGVFAPAIELAMQGGAPIDPNALAALQSSEPQKIEMLKNGMIAGAMATQPIFAGGQIINGNRLAKAGVEVRQLQKQIAENEVLLETERYFWQLVALQEKMKTIENSEAMLNRILSDVQAAVSAGLTTGNDLLRVELEQNKLQSGKLTLENGLSMLKISLGQKIGVPADSFNVQAPQIEAPLSPPSPFGDDSSEVQRRPEYRLLEKSVEVAKLQRNMEVGKKLPTVAIGAGYNYMNFDMHREDGMKNDFGMVFASVSIPITDWWGGAHAVRRKKLELQQAENAKKENAELLSQQMQNIHNGLGEAYAQVLLAQKSIRSAEQNLKISQDSYNAGVVTLSDLLEAQNLVQQSNDRYAEAAAGYFVKLAEWRQVSD
ncbi:MAG: TolC family protein [Prevotellaceae bacterium]|jgi:outer membrane protein TolC|nr:TolC family protein [Prevotellaceae bacterium]